MITSIHVDACRRYLSEGRAERFKGWEHRGNLGEYIILRWPDIPMDATDECKNLLRTYGAAKNMEPSKQVVDPKAGREPFIGTWMCGNVWHQSDDNGQTNSIYQVIYRGSFSIDFTVSENGCAYRVWTSYYYEAATLIPCPDNDSANGITYRRSDPQMDPERGTFSYFIEKRQRLYQTTGAYTSQEDASVTVSETKHTGVKDGDTNDSGSAITIPSYSAGTVVDSDRQREADCTLSVTTRARAAKNQVGSEVESRADQTSATATETQAVSQAAGTPQVGKIVRAASVPTEFGRWRTSTEVVTPVNQTATDTEQRGDQSSVTAKDTQADAQVTAPAVSGTITRAQNQPTEFGKVRRSLETVTPHNQTSTDVESRGDQTSTTEKQTQATAPDPGTPITGKIVRASNTNTEFGLYRVARETVTPINQTNTDTEARADQTSTTQKATQADAEVSAAAVAGTISRASNQSTEFGKVRTSRETITAIDQTGSEAEARSDQTTTRVTHTQNTASETTTPATGTISRVGNVPTEFGRNRTFKETVTAVNQSNTDGEARGDQISSTVKDTQADSEYPATAVPGAIIRVANQYTEFGKVRRSKETVTPVNQASTDAEIRADQTSTTAKETQADAPATATPTAGAIVRASNQNTEFGKYRKALETITAIDQTTSQGEDRHDQATATDSHTQAASALASPAAAPGTIKRTTNRATEFGRYATAAETITAKNQTATGGEARADQVTVVATETQGSSEASAAAIAGVIVRASNRPTEFGRVARSREVVTPINQTGSQLEERGDQSSTTSTNTQRDTAETVAAVAGQIQRAANAPTEFGKNRTSKEVVTAKDQTGRSVEIRADQSSAADTHTQSASPASESAVTGAIVRADSQPTEFGLHRTRREVVTPVDQTGSMAEARGDQDSATVTHSQNTVDVAAASAVGQIQRAANVPTEFGRKRTSLETIIAKDQSSTDGETRADQISATVKHTQSAVPATAGSISGAIQRASNQPTEFGLFRTSKETIIAVDQTGSASEARQDQTSATTTHTQNIGTETASGAPGTIVRASNQPTEFGRNRTSRETITSVDQTSTDQEFRQDQTSTTVKHTQAASAATGSGAAGTIVRTTNQPTEFGRMRSAKETVTAIDQVSTDGETRADQTSTTTKHSQSASPALPTTAGAGTIVRASNRATEFGRYQYAREVVTAIDQTSTDREVRQDQVTVKVKHTQGAAVVAAGGVGTIARAVNTPTEFGKHRTEAETTTAIAQSLTFSYNTIGETVYVDHLANGAVGTAPARAAGLSSNNENHASGSRNIFGLEDSTTVQRVRVPGHYQDVTLHMQMMHGEEWYDVDVYIIFTWSQALANNHLTMGPVGGDNYIVPAVAGYQTGKVEILRGYWRATRVEVSKDPKPYT